MWFLSIARRLVAWGFILGWGSAQAMATTVAPLTLEVAVQRGVSHAPLLAARDSDIDAMHDEAGRAGQLPDPSMTFGVANYPVSDPGAFSLRSDTMTMRTVGVTQYIPSRAARDADRTLAGAQIDAAEADRVSTTQTLRERIANAWIDVWAMQRKRSLLDELRGENTLAIQITQARLRGGEGGAVDALAARADASALDNRLDAVDADLAAAQASLRRWLGEPTSTVVDASDFGQLPVSPDRLKETIDRQAPMQAWQAREQVAQAELSQARAATHPDWSVSATYGKRAPNLSDMVTLQVGVSLPLFTRNRQDRGISAKQAQWDAVEFAHEDARRAQGEMIERTVATWQGWNRQIQHYEDTLLPLDHDRAQTALASYRAGGLLQPWLDARREQIERRLDLADALAARARLWASLAYLMPPTEVTP